MVKWPSDAPIFLLVIFNRRLRAQSGASGLDRPSPNPVVTWLLGYAYLANGQYQEAVSLSQEVMDFSGKYGSEYFGTPALSFMGYALAAKGDLDRGLELVERAEEIYLKTNRRYYYATVQIFYGQLYLRIVEGGDPRVSPSWSRTSGPSSNFYPVRPERQKSISIRRLRSPVKSAHEVFWARPISV